MNPLQHFCVCVFVQQRRTSFSILYDTEPKFRNASPGKLQMWWWWGGTSVSFTKKGGNQRLKHCRQEEVRRFAEGSQAFQIRRKPSGLFLAFISSSFHCIPVTLPFSQTEMYTAEQSNQIFTKPSLKGSCDILKRYTPTPPFFVS